VSEWLKYCNLRISPGQNNASEVPKTENTSYENAKSDVL